MADYMNQTVKGQEISLNNETLKHKLSHGLIMEDCQINIKVSANGIIMSQAKFINCTFNFKMQINNFSFASCYFEGCIFTGKLSGCQFGHGEWIHKPENEKVKADIVDCDFSQMTSCDGIRFLDCDMSTIILPSFPHFTILDPYKNTNFLKDAKVSDGLKSIFDFNGDMNWLTEKDKALTFDARKLVSKYNLSLQEIENLLINFSFIKM